MNKSDDKFDTEIRTAWPENDEYGVPGFATTWRAAEARLARTRRRNRMLAGAAAVVAAVILGLQLQAPSIDSRYVEVDDLMGSTSWTAPSDVLLPEHDYDRYQELPTLLESTEMAGGSLL